MKAALCDIPPGRTIPTIIMSVQHQKSKEKCLSFCKNVYQVSIRKAAYGEAYGLYPSKLEKVSDVLAQ